MAYLRVIVDSEDEKVLREILNSFQIAHPEVHLSLDRNDDGEPEITIHCDDSLAEKVLEQITKIIYIVPEEAHITPHQANKSQIYS